MNREDIKRFMKHFGGVTTPLLFAAGIVTGFAAVQLGAGHKDRENLELLLKHEQVENLRLDNELKRMELRKYRQEEESAGEIGLYAESPLIVPDFMGGRGKNGMREGGPHFGMEPEGGRNITLEEYFDSRKDEGSGSDEEQ